jgi:hypothetical protein
MSRDVILTIICVLFACLAATALWALRKERHRNCRLYEQFHEARQTVYTMAAALRLTAEYAMLPAVEGWTWYEALLKYAPEELEGYPDYSDVPRVRFEHAKHILKHASFAGLYEFGSGTVCGASDKTPPKRTTSNNKYCLDCYIIVFQKPDVTYKDEPGSNAKAKKFFESFD